MTSPPIFFDTETCGLHGPIVLLQYAKGDDPVTMVSVWKETVGDVMDLLEMLATNPGGIVGFNLAFDWFHVCQMYSTLARLPDRDCLLEDCIDEYALSEAGARDGDCIKPVSACDLMLVARKGPYQSLMARKPIRIRRVPTLLAHGLAQELEQRIKLKDIYFSKRKNKNLPKWEVKDCKLRDDEKIDPNFKDVVMDFKASAALKVIANDILGADRYGRERFNYEDIELAAKHYPVELGWAPFATAMSSPKHSWIVPRTFPMKSVRIGKKTVDIRGKKTWPAVIEHHIRHWTYGTYARMYAEDDVKDTRSIWEAFDRPPQGDMDSELACMISAVRWRGFAVDLDEIKTLREKAFKRARSAPRAPAAVKDFLFEVMSPVERLGTKSTAKMILEKMAGNERNGIAPMQTDCPDCDGEGVISDEPCPKCKGSGGVTHPVSFRAAAVLDARKAKKDVEIFDKLLVAGRFHVSLNPTGTLSNRMSGADNLNAQAIRNDKQFRGAFTLRFRGTVLCGGDFLAFEVSLAEANYNDKKLREQLLSTTECYKCGGKDSNCEDCQGTNKTPMKIHALFGTMCFPTMTYREIVLDKIIYTRSKSGFFSKIYGGNYITLMNKLNVDEKSAIEAENRFDAAYEGVGNARKLIYEKFCSMRQPAGIGSHVEWHEPADYIENMLDPPFRRYFLLENQICKALYELANSPPKAWREFKDERVQRDQRNRERYQTIGGAVQSALYGCAFQIQAANMRAAGNTVIQSTGAEITKATQLEIWKIQPAGINRWLVQPMNIHDEIECVIDDDPALVEKVEAVVKAKVESYRPLVPLIGIEWKNYMKSWGEK